MKSKVSIKEIRELPSSDSDGLYSCLRYTLISCKWLGLLPISGLNCRNSAQLRFTFKSMYSVIYIFTVIGQFIMIGLCIHRQIRNGTSMINFTNSVFYASGLIYTLVTLKFATTWPIVVSKAEKLEAQLPPTFKNMKHSCNQIMAFVLIAAFVEHLLSVLHGFKVAVSCTTTHEYIKTFFIYNFPWIFEYIPFAIWIAVLAEIFNIQSTFLWSFNDLIIMVSSVYLAEQFRTQAVLLKMNYKRERFIWHLYRQRYWHTMRLTRLINKQIGLYVILSFVGNLYWICTQLFNSLNSVITAHLAFCKDNHEPNYRSIEHQFYFAYSFGFLVIRTMLVAMLGADIHSASREPLIYLYGVPTMNFNVDVQRFIDQIKYSNVALSGFDFFHVTRKVIPALMGTIVTYELVLLQFNIGSIVPCSNNNDLIVLNKTEN